MTFNGDPLDSRITILETYINRKQVLKREQLEMPEVCYPLKVVRCDQCMLVQLSYVVPPEILYQNEYPYEASMTKTGQSHFDAFANSVTESFNLSKGDLVVDIGSNVGVLLQGFKKRGCSVLGIDPAENIAQIAEKNGIETIPDFFTQKVINKVIKNYGKAKIVTATNVFAHVDDLHAFMKGIDTLLDEDGIFIIEAPYLMHLLDNLEYDTIYHEHLSYLSLIPLVPFFHHRDFELFDVKQVDIHGGSNRMFISRKGKMPVSSQVLTLIKDEEEKDIYSIDFLNEFAKRVKKNRLELIALLRSLKGKGARIAGVSAPAKGMTLLNYCKIDDEYLEFITEKSKLKIGRFSPGSHFSVLPDSALITENIDYALLLAWNFKDEIMKNLEEFKNRGGQFIIPIPEPSII